MTDSIQLDRNEFRGEHHPDVVSALADVADPARAGGYPRDHLNGPGDLVAALARHHDVDPAQIVLGHGIAELLPPALRLFAGGGRRVFGPAASWPTYGRWYTAAAAKISYYPQPRRAGPDGDRYVVDTDALCTMHDFNPGDALLLPEVGNPTGAAIDPDEVRDLVRFFSDVPVISDGAYHDYGPTVGTLDDPIMDLVRGGAHPNLIVMRTFSKGFGLAWWRTAYAVLGGGRGHAEYADMMDRPLGFHGASAHVALAALGAADHYRAQAAQVAADRDRLCDALAPWRPAGVRAYRGHGNFTTTDYPPGLDGRVVAGLRAHGITTRSLHGEPGLDRTVRITAGTAAENALVRDVLSDTLAHAAA